MAMNTAQKLRIKEGDVVYPVDDVYSAVWAKPAD